MNLVSGPRFYKFSWLFLQSRWVSSVRNPLYNYEFRVSNNNNNLGPPWGANESGGVSRHHFLNAISYFTLLYFTLLYFTLFHFTLLYFYFYFTLLYFTLLCFALLCFALLCFTLLYFTLLYFTLLYFTLLYISIYSERALIDIII